MQLALCTATGQPVTQPARTSTPGSTGSDPGVPVGEERQRSGIRYAATFSPDPDRTYRYTLSRVWDDRRPTVTFVMLNPSTADAYRDDATIRRCLGFARSWQAGGLVVVNLYALRATDPAQLLTHPDPVGPANDTVLAAQLCTGTSGVLVAAWGAHRAAVARAATVYALLRAQGLRPQCLGTTSGGQPRHPLRLAATTPLVEYAGPDRTPNPAPPPSIQETTTMATADTLVRIPPAATGCRHTPPCPAATAVDRDAAAVVASHPEQGWNLRCNGVITFDDTGELLPDGSVVAPRRGPAPHRAAP